MSRQGRRSPVANRPLYPRRVPRPWNWDLARAAGIIDRSMADTPERLARESKYNVLGRIARGLIKK